MQIMRNVSIVIVNWNGINHLKKLLPSSRKLTYPNLEIIIVDNKSTDGSIEYIRHNDPHIHIIENNQNDG
ncbi:MAG: glycosyltransferase, partial [Saprospiraceae bacterium]|nr:glycosyltransferase [Saprospiraceae bacterium]